MRLRPYWSQSHPPIRAPIPAEIAFELNAPMSPTKLDERPKSSVHRARPAAPATIEPASM